MGFQHQSQAMPPKQLVGKFVDDPGFHDIRSVTLLDPIFGTPLDLIHRGAGCEDLRQTPQALAEANAIVQPVTQARVARRGRERPELDGTKRVDQVLLVMRLLSPEDCEEGGAVSLRSGQTRCRTILALASVNPNRSMYPLPLEKAFLQNFLLLATLPPDQSTPFEGMAQLISLVIEEAYRACTEIGGGSKPYRPGLEPDVDRALQQHQIQLDAHAPYWRDVVDALCDRGDYYLAERAQRYAVPILEDLIGAVRSDQVRDLFDSLKLSQTSEKASQIFERYIADLIRRFPTLNAPTQLDFGPARIIVLDLQYVAPTGSAAANRQTEMMYLLARHILARNFFLHPEYVVHVPERVRAYHDRRFREVYETVKRVDYDEWHRTQGSALVRAQADLDVREGRKHNVQLGFASQRLSDMGDGITRSRLADRRC